MVAIYVNILLHFGLSNPTIDTTFSPVFVIKIVLDTRIFEDVYTQDEKEIGY